MTRYWKELLLKHLLLSLPEKVHSPEFHLDRLSGFAPRWVKPQPSHVSLLGHQSSLSPCSFLDSCFRIDLNSPCLQVDHINTGLPWRLPELSWNCNTQRVSQPQDWKVGCLRTEPPRRTPSVSPQRKAWGRASALELLPQDLRWTVWKKMSHHPLAPSRWSSHLPCLCFLLPRALWVLWISLWVPSQKNASTVCHLTLESEHPILC